MLEKTCHSKVLTDDGWMDRQPENIGGRGIKRQHITNIRSHSQL